MSRRLEHLHYRDLCHQGPNNSIAKSAPKPDHLPKSSQVGLYNLRTAEEPFDGHKLHDASQSLVISPVLGLKMFVQSVDGVTLEFHGRCLVDVLIFGQRSRGNVQRCPRQQWRLDAERHVIIDEGIIGVANAIKGAFEMMQQLGDYQPGQRIFCKKTGRSATPLTCVDEHRVLFGRWDWKARHGIDRAGKTPHVLVVLPIETTVADVGRTAASLRGSASLTDRSVIFRVV